jgi:hypothetical protein
MWQSSVRDDGAERKPRKEKKEKERNEKKRQHASTSKKGSFLMSYAPLLKQPIRFVGARVSSFVMRLLACLSFIDFGNFSLHSRIW